jgi:hypothetical protein
MMISLADGSYVNSETIRLMRYEKRDGLAGILLVSTDGNHEYHAPGDVDELAAEINAKIIGAELGYALITAASDSCEEFWHDREAIIAWRVGGHGCPEPVTVSDTEKARNPHAILCPDGRVIEQYNAEFKTIDEWEAHAREEWAKDRARWLEKHPPEAVA